MAKKKKKIVVPADEIGFTAFQLGDGEWFGEVTRGGEPIKTLDYPMPTEEEATIAASMWAQVKLKQ
jgi:hypothetical protein